MGVLNLDTGIMIVYLLGMLALGVYCSRFIKTFDDFFVAGRRLGFPLAVGTMSALFVGGSAIGVAGMGHDYGIGAIWYYIAYGIGFTALGLTFVVPLRAMNEYTVADIFAHRYGEKVRFVSSIITFFAWIFFFAAFVVAGARVVEALLGWPLWVSILVTAGIFTIYTSVGGMWAVTMTDFVQFVILVVGLLVIFPVSIHAVGGFTGLYNSLDSGMFSLIPRNVGGQEMSLFDGMGYVVATLVVTCITGIVGPDVYIRVWCAKDNRTAKNVLYAVSIMIVFGAIMLALIGMCANVLNPGIEHEMAMPWMIRNLLPSGLAGLILVALMAAAISGAVPELVVCSSILANDVYKRVINKEADDKQLLKAG
ncbi:sodium:solute symporter family protein, partial [Slackia heliotrinireducens]|uniref:sodium:solute symporter family protein n=1 Tax=Slackia heliotrinireducens TaxID=84110 RepID=UPI003314A5B0